VVVGGEGSQCELVGVVVVNGGGEGEDADDDTVMGSGAVAFEVELAFEGVVDRLDDLAERFEEPGAGSWSFVLERRSQQSRACFR
jgi:hypothetical protein